MDRINRGRVARVGAALAGAALLVGQLAFGAAPAQAAPAGVNCVGDLTGRAGLVCFDTLTEAVRTATAGRFADAPRTGAEAVKDPAFAAGVAAANADGRAALAARIVISIEYDLANHDETDGTLIWYGDKECSNRTTDVDYSIANYNVSAPAWVNRITSFQTFGNCWTKHYENTNFGGASVGFQGSRNHIGAAMDNRTSSEQWS
ncbi:hypothetical protein O7627_07855 [Solwaraspora sp. WMMD1047]|uniref:hypothetical protein n=1 Tax=Solwaraspora sp. WMMD1047 TaxID=3016102 RepID=UPI002416947F|nr:hypothetical protein [Solwaraspora sp. WMMD1047]MDG4829220.1 hypothetical protein [Solwaraspora sp. WMMD1047]